MTFYNIITGRLISQSFDPSPIDFFDEYYIDDRRNLNPIEIQDFWEYGFINNSGYHYYVEIDESIAPIIQVLNNIGYKTLYCCSHHFHPSTYNERALDAYILIKGECEFNDLPYGWTYEINPDYIANTCTRLSYIFNFDNYNNYYDFEYDRCHAMKSLYDYLVKL